MLYKPEIRIFWQNGVSNEQIELAIEAVNLFLKHARATEKIKVTKGREFNLDVFKESENSKWKNYLDCLEIFYYLSVEQSNLTNYTVVLLVKDRLLYKYNNQNNFVHGVGCEKAKVAIVYSHGQSIFENTQIKNYFVGNILHELGHVFNLPNPDRHHNIMPSITGHRHCARLCTMRPNTEITDKLDLQTKPFCLFCIADLRRVFVDRIKRQIP